MEENKEKFQLGMISIECGSDTRIFVKKVTEYAKSKMTNEIFDDELFFTFILPLILQITFSMISISLFMSDLIVIFLVSSFCSLIGENTPSGPFLLKRGALTSK